MQAGFENPDPKQPKFIFSGESKERRAVEFIFAIAFGSGCKIRCRFYECGICSHVRIDGSKFICARGKRSSAWAFLVFVQLFLSLIFIIALMSQELLIAVMWCQVVL
jgi:hypothetical protein